MSELLITVLSLVVGAVLASLSGIYVTYRVDKRKEEKELEVFKLEFKLAIGNLYEKLNQFNEIYEPEIGSFNKREENYHSYQYDIIEVNERISKPFINCHIFQDYSSISKISKYNINNYYNMIQELIEIDSLPPESFDDIRMQYIGYDPSPLVTDKKWSYINSFNGRYLDEIKNIMESL